MGLLYLARCLEKEKDVVKVIDFSAEPYDENKLRNEIRDIDLIGITVLTASFEKTKEMISLIKKEKPEVLIVIGGPHCTLFPEKSLDETDADISVQGPGERVIIEVKKHFRDFEKLKMVNSIYFKDGKVIRKGRPRIGLDEIDSISFPSRNLVSHYRYGTGYNPSIKKGEFTSIITSRGCPFSCRFCSRSSISLKKYVTRSISNIIEELEQIEKAGFKYVAFVDDCFLADKKQALEIFNEIINKKIHLKYYITAARVDSADEKLYKQMKKAGVVFIQFGFESGNQDVLDYYRKNITLNDIKIAANLSYELGFYTAGSFILGASFETKEHFKKTIEFAQELPLVSVSFLPLKYMAGSELWNEAIDMGNISSDEYIVNTDRKRGLGKFSEKEIDNWVKYGHRRYYLRLKFFFHFLVVSIKQSDFSFLLSYIHFYLRYFF